MIANQITEITDQMLAEFQPNFRKKKTPRGNYEEFLEANGAKKVSTKKSTNRGSSAPISFIDPVEEIKRAQAEKAQYEASLRAETVVSEPASDYQAPTEPISADQTSVESALEESPTEPNTDPRVGAEVSASDVPSSALRITKLYVRLVDASNRQKLTNLRQICQNYPGKQSIILVLGENDQKTAIKLPFQVTLSEQLMTNLKQEFAEQDLVLR